MTDQHPMDTFLKQQLRNNTPYIADDGFSETFVARLPRRRVFPLGLLSVLLVCTGLLLAIFFAAPVLLAPIYYWAAGLTLGGIIKIGIGMGAFILVLTTAWMARQLDWL